MLETQCAQIVHPREQHYNKEVWEKSECKTKYKK